MVRGLTIDGGNFRSLRRASKYALRTALLLFLWLFLQNNASAQITANFSASVTQGCSPLVVCFTDLSTGNPNTWLWNFGNGNLSPDHNPCAIYIVPGTYTVSLTASDGSSTDTKTVNALITVFANPVVNFSASKTLACAGEDISFTDMTSLGDAPIVSWRWDFGDGSTSNQRNPTHTYTNPNTYTVYLEVTDANGCVHRKTVNNMITILAAPSADFDAVPNFACSYPATINFTDQSSGSQITTYLWNFGDGFTSNQQNPVHTYSTPGSYNVTLKVTNSAGCSNTKTINGFIVIDNLQADFSVDNTSGCGDLSVNFTDQSSTVSSVTGWDWDFGDGGTSNVENTTHQYTAPGIYDVTLIVTNNRGCKDTIVYNDLITVYVEPTANFTADKTKGCSLPLVVNFSETATDDASWLWEFGDGSTSTQQNPTHSYTNAGSYGVRLTVTSTDGCTATRFKANYIQITGPTANFGADARDGCIDLTVNFEDRTNSTDPVTNWFWDFGDGGTSTLQNPSHVYTTEGEFDVLLVIENSAGCIDSILRTGYIEAGDTPVVNFGSDRQHVCLGTPIQFYDSTDVGDEWHWDFGDGGTSSDSTPNYTYGDTGAFSVTLVVLNRGCADTLMIDDYVSIAPPRAGVEVIHNCSNPFEVIINDNSLGPDEWHWTFGDGDTSNTEDNVHIYASTGNYIVGLFVRDTMSGCVDSTTTVVRVTDPVADFSGSPLAGCYPLIVYFTSNSIDADTYQWFFGDGDTSSQQDPIKIYDTTGVYDVSLVITDIHGCSDTIVKTDYVTVYGANAWFAADTLFGCTPLNVDYADSSTSFLGTVTSWNWDFGDGTSSALQNPLKVYNSPGIYSVGLRVGDSNGCVDSILRVNYIIPTFPVSNFSADDTIVCVGQDVYFDNTSIGTGMTFLWNFGDGATSTDSLPVHSYSTEGVYTVSLKATDINGCDSTLVKPLYIRVTQPHAALTADSTFASCPPLWVNFTDLTPVNDSITDWLWDFGDNQTSDLQHPIHVYTTPDTFLPSLIVTDFNGCKDTAVFVPITLTGPVGTFNFIQNEYCVPVPIQFFSDAADSIIHIYDYGDGGIGIYVGGDTIVHDYTYPGVFHPSLVLDDGHGCVISIDHPDSIITFTVVADFMSDIQYLCHASVVQFWDSNSHGVTNPISWFWDFGDGDTSTLKSPTHYYSVPGSYDVMLVVTNAEGCTDTMIKPKYITVDPGPVADFTPSDNDVCIPETVSFVDASVSDSTIISWFWNFGDGATSTVQNPSHTYTTVDTFTVTLMIETVAGCRDTVSKTIITNGPPVADAGPDQAICYGDSVQLNGSGGVTYLWSPVDDLSNPTISNPVASPDSTTTYVLTVFNSIGCSDSDSMVVTIHPLPVVGSSDAAICAGGSAQLTASGGVIYLWSPGSSLNDSTIANPIASPLSTTNYTITITDANGCINVTGTTLTVHPLPVPSASAATAILCEGDSVQLNATGGVIYSWLPSTGLNNPNIPNPVAVPQTGVNTYIVTVTDSNGCVNMDTVTLTTHPMPVYHISPNVTICEGDTADFAIIGGSAYNWYPPAGLSCTNCPDPRVFPDTTTTYYVEITSTLGCMLLDSVTVTVNPKPVVTITSDATICSSSPIQLNATGGVSYSWSPATWLNNTNTPSPTAFPLTTTTYTVTVTNSFGCTNTASINVRVNPLPIATVSPDTAMCVGSSANLSASGGTSYQWFPDSTLTCATCPNTIATPDTTTTYQVSIINNFGCMVTRFVTVTVHPMPIVTVTKDTFICSGSSVQLNAVGGTNYSWTPAAGLDNPNIPFPVASPTTSTTYIVQVISPFGCSSYDSVKVDVLDFEASMILSDTIGCLPVNVQFTDLSTATDSIVSWHYDFGDGKTSSLTSPYHVYGTAGVYNAQLTITTVKGCVDSTNALVFVHDLPDADAGPDTAICRGESVTLHGSGGGRYDWSPSVGLNAIDIANPVATPNVTRYYELIVTDNVTGCMDKDSVLITVNDLPVTTVSAGASLCFGDSTQLEATGGYSYSWTPAEGLSNPDISNPVATPHTTTMYVVNVTTEFGCMAVDSVLVMIRPLPELGVKADGEICLGDSTQFDITGAVQYDWYPTTGLSCSDCANPVANPDTSTTYLLRMVDPYNCIWYDTIPLVVNPVPTVQTTADQTICKGEQVELTTQQTGATIFLWTPADGLNSADTLSPIASPAQTTEYVITASNTFGCYDKDSVIITVLDRVQTVISDNMRICVGTSVTLEARIEMTGINGASVRWYPESAFDEPTQLTQTVSPSVPTTYTMIVTGGTCIPDTQYVHVHVDENPDVDAGEDRLVLAGTEVTFNATSNYSITSWYWSPAAEVSCYDCPSTSIVANESATFYVNVVDANGCPATDSVRVRVIKTCDGDIWVPNAFTPNGDESNDLFRVRSTGLAELITFRIFDRWGNLVYRNDENFHEGWDGKYKGVMVNPDVYVWWVRASCPNGEIVDLKGNVTAIR